MDLPVERPAIPTRYGEVKQAPFILEIVPVAGMVIDGLLCECECPFCGGDGTSCACYCSGCRTLEGCRRLNQERTEEVA